MRNRTKMCVFAHTACRNNDYLCGMNQGTILIVDDNEDVLFALNLLLKPHFRKVKVSTTPDRIAQFMESDDPDVILLDMNFSRDASSGQEGMEVLHDILKRDAEAVVVMMTAYSDMSKAINAIKAGATDFVAKPWENEKLIATLTAAAKLRQARREKASLQKQMEGMAESSVPPIIGRSGAMMKVLDMVEVLAKTDANVLILGENGTGKDLVARALHGYSARAAHPLVTIDLGSIPETLFEGELFGYERGAFTDAHKSKAGRMEIASGGTLFLDEIGNLSLPLQSKLLSAIEKGTFTRLGSTREQRIDVRFICATNSNLHERVSEGTFRQDLLYRINTVEIHMPPLRERGDDVLLLADYFVDIYKRKYKKEIRSISNEAKAKLMRYAWPGNVRELQHAVERAVILSEHSMLGPQLFTLRPAPAPRKVEQRTLNLEKLEREAIAEAVRVAEGNVNQAAELLGITRYALYRKIEKHGL